MMTLVKAAYAMVAVTTLSACGAPPAPVSPAPSLTAPPAIALPEASNLCEERDQIVPGAVVAVTADTVPRRGPGTGYEETHAAVVRTGSPLPSEPYQLAAGDRLVVEEGPLRVGDVEWFLVYSADYRGEISVGSVVPTSAAWVPADDGSEPLLELRNPETLDCQFNAAGGAGAMALNIPAADCSSSAGCLPASIAWAAVAPSGGVCSLLVTIPETGTVVVEEAVVESATGASWRPQGDARLVIRTDCTWSLRTAEG